jgi:hypothetical protein
MAHLAEGKAIIDVAIDHASEGARIILLYVVEEVPNWIANATGRKMEVEVRTGHSYNTILDVAEEKDVDMVIIASHRPGLQDYFLGSTAAKVVRHAKCSVLVVR